jgi:hypothetical protein
LGIDFVLEENRCGMVRRKMIKSRESDVINLSGYRFISMRRIQVRVMGTLRFAHPACCFFNKKMRQDGQVSETKWGRRRPIGRAHQLCLS